MHNQLEEFGEVQLPGDLLSDGVYGLHLLDMPGQGVLGLLALRDIHRTHNDPSNLPVPVAVRQLVRLHPPQHSSSRGMGYDDVALWLARPDDFQIIGVISGGDLMRIQLPYGLALHLFHRIPIGFSRGSIDS